MILYQFWEPASACVAVQAHFGADFEAVTEFQSIVRPQDGRPS